MRLKALLAVGAVCLCLGSAANAQFTNVPIPANAYITLNGFDWAWASPVGPGFGAGLPDLTFQGTQGWRFPTAAELLLAPLATDFLVPGGNVPFNGADPITGANFQALNANYSSAASAAALAVPYFTDDFDHADWNDGLGQSGEVWAGMPGATATSDSLMIRGSGLAAAAPEPGTLALLALGAVGFLARRRK